METNDQILDRAIRPRMEAHSPPADQPGGIVGLDDTPGGGDGEESSGPIASLSRPLQTADEALKAAGCGETDPLRGPESVDRRMLGEARQSVHRVAEDYLRLSCERNAVLEALPANMALLDRSGDIVAVNQAWRRFGDVNGLATADHGVGCNYLQICAAAADGSAREAERGLREILAGRRDNLSLEYPCHSPNRRRWYRLLASPMVDGEGAVVLHLDVTALKLSEEAQVKSERRWRRLVETLPDALFALNEGAITLANDAAARLLGVASRHALTGERWLRFVHPEDGWTERSDAAPGAATEELRLRRVDGSEVEVEVSRRRIELLSRPSELLMARDVSDRKRAQQEVESLNRQLFQAQKLDAVGRLAGGVAHDFNNLLTAINGFGELLLQRLDENDPARVYASEIHQAGSRAADLTRQLLTFAREQPAHPEALGLDERIGTMERMVRGVVGESTEVELRLEAAPDRIWADPGQVEQVLMNLVLNARDAMPEGGRLTIATGRSAMPANGGRGVYLRVKDTGTGMDDDVLAQVFDPFFTTKGAGRGTGLGLPTVYGIVKRAGGEIEVDSAPGKGTEVRVVWPRYDGEGSSPPDVEEPRPDPGPMAEATVLVVEDEKAVRDLVAEVLAPRVRRLLLAQDGAEASRLGDEAERIDLLLSDVILPGSNGRDVAAALRSRHPDARVLFMTGYSRDELSQRLQGEPELNVLAKPFTPQQLLATVDGLLADGV